MLFMKLLILYGVFLTSAYLLFRAYYINFTPALLPFSLLLYLAELHTLILLFGMFYSLWPRKYPKYISENKNKNLQINIFIPVCGEPIEVVKDTIKHAQAASLYYQEVYQPLRKPRVIVLNDGRGAKKDNWQDGREVCKEIGVYHVARKTNEGFKAGNINNGLKLFPADDPHNTIDCFFDSDFCAKKEFLTEILKPLVDDSVDFVQSPQRYKNLNTWVAKAAGAHQIFFFDYICPAKAYDNALFLCGTNYAIRRSALIATEGVEKRFVTEDYATSIKLHLIGKKGVFISKVLAYGLAPMNLKEYFNQQTRWCKGCLDANRAYLKDLVFGPLTKKQKLHYFLSTVYYFIGVRDAILILAPVPYLFFNISLIRANTVTYLAFIYLPLLIYNFTMFFLTFRDPIKSLVLDVVSFPVFAKAFLASVIGKNLPFSITIKKYEKENPFRIYKIQLIVASLLFAGLIYSSYIKVNYNPYGKFINHFWAMYSATFLLLGFILIIRENVNVSFIEDRLKIVWQTFLSSLTFTRKVAFRPAFAMAVILAISLTSGYQIRTGGFAYAKAKSAIVRLTKQVELLVPGEGAYYGYYFPELNYHPKDPEVSFLYGEKPSLAMYYQDFSTDSKFNVTFMNNLYEKGVIPVVTWEPWIRDGGDDVALNQEGKAADVILSGEYDRHIREWAKAAKKHGKPYFLRFAHEMNGNWYAWGDTSSDSAEKYKKMWVHIHNIFESEGSDNAIWVWSPNNTNNLGKADTILNFYPGSEYVDWVGFSTFNWGKANSWNIWMDFKTASWEAYSILTGLNKPIMVAETSSVSSGGDKAGWFWQTFHKDIPSMPGIKAVVIFNQNDANADFALDSGMDGVSVIKSDIVDNGYYLNSPNIVYR